MKKDSCIMVALSAADVTTLRALMAEVEREVAEVEEAEVTEDAKRQTDL